ncbi:hypothetical protein QFC21_000600 [Naganishia friedmannii]|uniref:Uncharacterized protein n=1 Tax=Naganishia friedmannii TaxID=89922 RepID=A0ACC2WEK0_9TREE|nr:hypothetical protein QFC21_000600 [Naganishia friedmannii]
MSSYPTTSLHSFSDVLQKRLTSPFSICLGVGLGAASYHAFANVSSYFYGPVPAINEEKLELKKDVGQAVQVWEWFYENATLHATASSLIGSLALVGAGFLIPPSSFSTYPRELRRLLWGAAVLVFAPLPYSALIMGPNDKVLLDLNKKIVKNKSSAGQIYPTDSSTPAKSASVYASEHQVHGGLHPTEEAQASALLGKWQSGHLIRTVISVIGFEATMLATFMAF